MLAASTGKFAATSGLADRQPHSYQVALSARTTLAQTTAMPTTPPHTPNTHRVALPRTSCDANPRSTRSGRASERYFRAEQSQRIYSYLIAGVRLRRVLKV